MIHTCWKSSESTFVIWDLIVKAPAAPTKTPAIAATEMPAVETEDSEV